MTTNLRRGFLGGSIAAAFMLIGATSRAADPPVTADVLQKLHESNQKEIQAGKMAEKNGQSKQVKDYGKMLVKDHSAADKKVSALAKQETIDLPAPAAGAHEMSGMAADPSFDGKFAQEMLEDHKKDIAEVTEARDNTKDAKLKKLLSDMLPTLQKHEEAAQKIVDTQATKK
jgi:putative membrane protein